MTVALSLWQGELPLVLASGSATRRQLLEAAGLPIIVARPDTDERKVEQELVHSGSDSAGTAAGLALAKARDVSARMPSHIVLGADQVLDLDGERFHKPEDMAAAATHIARLAGRTHRLISAFALVRGGKLLRADSASASLTIRALSDTAIARYCAAAGPAILSSVGAYQLEGLGIHLFSQIKGDHSTILGLPLLPLLKALRHLEMLAE
ncbi:MAG: Maf family protein [Bosea sp. (in: a-proteobacteria)]